MMALTGHPTRPLTRMRDYWTVLRRFTIAALRCSPSAGRCGRLRQLFILPTFFSQLQLTQQELWSLSASAALFGRSRWIVNGNSLAADGVTVQTSGVLTFCYFLKLCKAVKA